jgi:hypothetical protein
LPAATSGGSNDFKYFLEFYYRLSERGKTLEKRQFCAAESQRRFTRLIN